MLARQFQPLDSNAMSDLIQGASVLEQDGSGIKVLHLADGSLLKLFRVKRWYSSALFYPYSLRFFRNAHKLLQLSVPTLMPLALYRLPEKWKTAVRYEPLPGKALRQVVEGDPELGRQLGRFVAELHGKGIYFRSLHLGNIILTPDGRLGLIDVADTHFSRFALSRGKRLRNLMHLCRLKQDRLYLEKLGWRGFCEGYWSTRGLERLCDASFRARMLGLLG